MRQLGGAGRGGGSHMQQRDIRRVAVIGTGTIGASWTAYFLARGLEVRASDPAPPTHSQPMR